MAIPGLPSSRRRGSFPALAITPVFGIVALVLTGPGETRVDVPEREPNNTIAQANGLIAGDVAVGVVNPTMDHDTWSVHLVAGSVLRVRAQTAGGYALGLLLRTADGTLVADNIESSPEGEYTTGALHVAIDRTDRYFVTAFRFSRFPVHENRPTPENWYRLATEASPPGPGEPTVELSTDLMLGSQNPASLVAGSGGELYALTRYGIVRVPVAGGPAVTISDLAGVDMALDAFGDLLVSAPSSREIRRVSTATRAVTRFASLEHAPHSIAIAPNGDVWAVADHSGFAVLYQFDPVGTLRRTVHARQWSMPSSAELSFSPRGELLLVSGSIVWRFEENGPFAIAHQSPTALTDLVFDSAGASYASTTVAGVNRLTPDFVTEHAPFAAVSLQGAEAMVFLTDATGAPTRRIAVVRRFAADFARIVMLDSTDVAAPGVVPFRIRISSAGLRLPQVGAPYDDTLSVGLPGTWSVAAGRLPPGITIHSNGRLSGTPETAGSYEVTVRVTFGGQRTVTGILTLSVVPHAEGAAQALLGAEPLPPEIETMLDGLGNRNGAYDVGDLRAALSGTGGASW